MWMKKLLDLNDIYSFQDTIILCEISENRANQMMNRFPYNPMKYSSASSLSGCIHRFLAITTFALPTKAEITELLEQTLIGGFSCVNTLLSFDSKIWLLKDKENKPNQKSELIYRIRNEITNKFENKRIVTKIIKMDENSQYGNAMIKPLPTGSIRKKWNAPQHFENLNLFFKAFATQIKSTTHLL